MKFGIIRNRFRTAFACGIVGFVGNETAKDYLLEGLQMLRSRGYDSAGISTLSEDFHSEEQSHEKILSNSYRKTKICTSKFASVTASDSFDILCQNVKNLHLGRCGIGHTRWATHGAKSDVNAHPHSDQNNVISLVHNGTIENWFQLKKELASNHDIKFKSETDSEVVVQLIALYYKKEKNLIASISCAISRLEGTYGLAIICRDYPDQIIAVRRGSPLVIGISEDKKWVASEYMAFSRYTKQYVSLKDEEIAIIKNNQISIDIRGRVSEAPFEEIVSSPTPFPHWTIKEISEQPEAIERALNYGGRLSETNVVMLGGLSEKRKILVQVDHLVICACGTSFYCALYAANLMRHLRSFHTVQVVNASEFEVHYLTERSALMVVSQSGETRDVLRAVKMALENNVIVFSAVNAVGSQIATLTNCGVYINAGREFGVASTKAFTSQVVVLVLVAIWFAQAKQTREVSVLAGDLSQRLHCMSIYTKFALQTSKQCERIAAKIQERKSLFVLGKGFGEAIAKEAALKIKEISYVHAEGFSAGELKHGPFALIEAKTPIFVILLNDKHAKLVRVACKEVLARGAELFVVTDDKALTEEFKASEVITVRSNGFLSALLCVIPFQMIAYYTALVKGLDPDKPRNLAKSVTVD